MKPNNLLLAVLAAGMLTACDKKQDAPLPAPTPTTGGATNQPATAAAPSPAFQKLKGKWQRPDGGYILDIRNVEPGGKMDAAYLNPRPINVAKAQAAQEGAVTKVFIELRDVNYPGSTYNLDYDAAGDRFTGIYYQAALQQKFEVEFVRTK